MRTKIKNLPYCVFYILLFISLLFIPGCGEPKELTRAKAEKLIRASNDFKSPYVIKLITLAESEKYGINKTAGDEMPEEGMARNLKQQLEYNSQIAVANHLGLITIDQKFVKEEKAWGWQVPARWYFDLKFRANEKGQALWKEFGFDPTDTQIPVAKKELIEITGITQLGDNQAMAEVRMKYLPNSIGKALQENSDEFKALPEEIKLPMLGKTPDSRYRQATIDWNAETRARVLFQRYDDGWRLIRFSY